MTTKPRIGVRHPFPGLLYSGNHSGRTGIRAVFYYKETKKGNVASLQMIMTERLGFLQNITALNNFHYILTVCTHTYTHTHHCELLAYRYFLSIYVGFSPNYSFQFNVFKFGAVRKFKMIICIRTPLKTDKSAFIITELILGFH